MLLLLHRKSLSWPEASPNSYSPPKAVNNAAIQAGPSRKRFFSKRRIYCQSLDDPQRSVGGSDLAMGEYLFHCGNDIRGSRHTSG